MLCAVVLEVCNGKPVYGGGGKDYGKIYNNLQQSASEVKNAVKDGYSQLADVSALIEDSLKQLKQLQKSAEEYNQMASSMVDQMNHAAYVAPNLDQYSNLVNYGSGGAGGYGRSNGATAYRSPPAAAYAAAPGAAGAYGGSSGVANAYGGASGGGYGGAGSVAYGAAAGGNGAYGGSVGAYAAPAGGAGAYGGAASGGAYAAAASSGNAGAYSEGSSAGKAYEVGGSSGYSSSSYTSAPKAQSAGKQISYYSSLSHSFSNRCQVPQFCIHPSILQSQGFEKQNSSISSTIRHSSSGIPASSTASHLGSSTTATRW